MHESTSVAPARAEGLRERKLREARVAAQRAAVELCLERGLDSVTVEMIADRAGISPRTFYNYFGTREAALLGDAKPEPTEDQVARFLARDDVSDVEAFAIMVAEAWAASQPDQELFLLRQRLYEAEPTLAAANLSRVGEHREALAIIARERVALRHPELTEPDLTLEATLTVALAMAAVQTVGRAWLADGNADLTQLEQLISDLVPRVRRLTQTPRA
ncbi:TetR/AcrR family transcriptional regulator [Demequina zhanjiangensis]|uniref:Helix-turn-helix domain-containing protein n=1 Tax=Demequina zhanjiangensis TaxID=3051659 RepID=A0ABT8G3B3_9MICO|nr:TetR/AcrR family transcriptional regulator [Demequina sp. SYSU T00b26]MDN4473562.1 helix-turn-helix domain-containing protein [Demequina sp. SYSU T00b26]